MPNLFRRNHQSYKLQSNRHACPHFQNRLGSPAAKLKKAIARVLNQRAFFYAFLSRSLSVLPERVAAEAQAPVDDFTSWNEKIQEMLRGSGAEH